MRHRQYENRILLHFLSCPSAERSETAGDSTIKKLTVQLICGELDMINLFIDIYLPNSVTYSKRTWYQPIDDIYLLNIAMKSSACTSVHLNWRRNSKKQDDNVKDRTLCYVYRTSQLLLLSSSRIEAMRSAFWAAESEALHSAKHYGPLKTRLYHRAKHYGPLKARLKNHGKISKFFYLSFIFRLV